MKTYLLDKKFLQELDAESQKEIYAKIVSLNVHEEPIESIEGRVTGGSINIDGSSSVRRSCNLTLVTQQVDINDIYWGFSNKFKLYIGVLNTINNKYEDIIWFPQGTFVINSFNSSYTTNDYSISISGQDKMCLLNGTLGGHIPMGMDFGIEEEKDADGYINRVKKSIHYSIRALIHFFGNEPLHNIIIRDLADSGLELQEYKGQGDIYILRDAQGEYTNILFDGDVIRYTKNGTPIKLNSPNMIYYQLSANADNHLATWVKNQADDNQNLSYQVVRCSRGEAAGYRRCELVWPEADGLKVNAGDTITSILDKVIKKFGDYEYFYDLDGHFVFQKKLTYINTSWNNMIANEEDETYIESEKIQSQYAYSFTDNKLISSFRNTPKIENIKNDYTIWGKKKGISGAEIDIHIRYGIQSKPKKYTNFNGETFYTNASDIKYEKRPNPNGLSEDWWAVDDWAEFYKLYTGHYPEDMIGTYCSAGKVNIDLNTMFGIASEEDIYQFYNRKIVAEGGYGKWFEDWETENHQTYVFDVLPNGKLGYLGHYGGCTHKYSYFLDMKNYNVTCYIYKPLLPTQDLQGGMIVDWRELVYQMALDYMAHSYEDDFEVILARNNPEFVRGITGYETYYKDLLAFWRLLYDPKTDDNVGFFVGKLLTSEEVEYYGWNRAVITDPSSLIFWFDLLDPLGSHLQKYTISAIGARSKVVNDTDVKSIIYKEVPSLVYLSHDEYEQLKMAKQLTEGYTYIPMPEAFNSYFSIKTQGKSAQQVLDNLLYEGAFINEKINLAGIPIYHLNPNTKIYVQDEKSGIFGDYIIDKITIPLTYNGTMNIEATRAPERLY